MESVAIPIVASDNKVGRPYKYETHVLPRIQEVYNWLCEGATDYSICDNLGISHQTWIDYKKTQVELIDVYTRVRTERCGIVMNQMYSKANGIKETVKKAKVLNDGTIIHYTEEQYVPPSENAADLYLRNNDPEYKSAKADSGGITLIQNNYQLPEIQAQIKALEDELKRLDVIDTTATEIE